jgi:hypothetical protein
MTDITIGATVARRSKGASTGRTGQIIELNDDQARVHWTKKSDGTPMSTRSWINASELMVVGSANKAIASIQEKMRYMVSRVQEGPLVQEEYDEMIGILSRVKGTDMWSIGIRKYLEGPRDHDAEFIAGLASQCMDDIFTMTCIVGQKCLIYLLRTVSN